MTEQTSLPRDHRFTFYLAEDGRYVLESQKERGLVIRGSTPDLVVMEMIELLPIWGSFKLWCKSCNSPIESDPVEMIMPTFENFCEMTDDSENSLARKLRRAYSDPVFCREALMLYKEFEDASMEVLSRSEPVAGQ